MNARGPQSIDVIVPVFNGGLELEHSLRRLLALVDRASADVRLIVCDDGSTDATAQRIGAIDDARLTAIRLDNNSGRAAACNAGAAAADAACLLFLDADCRPRDDDYFDVLADHAGEGAAMVYGPIAGEAEGFWQRYLERVEQRRHALALRNEHLLAMTTGNLLVRRELFVEAGAFCERFRRYGFEDKDLIVRLLDRGATPVYDSRAAVSHRAGNTVAGYCRKMHDAARYSATLFHARHPAAYRQMAYARIDPDLRPAVFAHVLRALGRHGPRIAVPLASWLVERRRLAWPVKSAAVTAAAALSFLAGAAERHSG